MKLLELLLGKKGSPENDTCSTWGPPPTTGGGDDQIMVCGSPGDKTNTLYEHTKAAASQMGLEEEIVLEHDPKEMGKYGILDSPALVVDGKLMSEGKILSVEEIVRILETA